MLVVPNDCRTTFEQFFLTFLMERYTHQGTKSVNEYGINFVSNCKFKIEGALTVIFPNTAG